MSVRVPLTLSLTPKGNATLGVRVLGGNFGGDVIGIQHEHAGVRREDLPPDGLKSQVAMPLRAPRQWNGGPSVAEDSGKWFPLQMITSPRTSATGG